MTGYRKKDVILCQIIIVSIPIIFILSVLVINSLFSRNEFENVAGVFSRCDQESSCLFSTRDHYSWDFLCCEDFKGWVATHATNVLVFYIFTGSFLTVVIPFVGEMLEYLIVLSFRNFLFLGTGEETDNETVMGILIGDVVIQGGTGLLIGLQLWYFLRFPSLIPNYFEVTKIKGHVWVFWKYLGLLVLHSGSFLATVYKVELKSDGTLPLNVGFLSATAFQLMLLWFVYPLYTNGHLDERYVWKGYSKKKRNVLFFVWGLITILIHVQNTGFIRYLPNEWYQAWVSQTFVVFVLFVLMFVKMIMIRKRKRKVSFIK